MILVKIGSNEEHHLVVGKTLADGNCCVATSAGTLVMEDKALAVEVFRHIVAGIVDSLELECTVVGEAKDVDNVGCLVAFPNTPSIVYLYGVEAQFLLDAGGWGSVQ
jgi:hypothetical protein